MDRPDLDEQAHVDALQSLARINRVTRSSALFWPAIRDAAIKQQARPVKVLDIACGGGDVTRDLARKARRHGLDLQLAGCDKSRVAVQHARRCHGGDPERRIDYFQLDVLHDALPDDYDILTCSLFLHHLSDREAVTLLGKMGGAARQLVLVSDLLRTRLGYALARIGPWFLARSPIVRTDAVLSVAAAFSRTEIDRLVHSSGLATAQIARRWPERFVLQWQPPDAAVHNEVMLPIRNPKHEIGNTFESPMPGIQDEGYRG